MLHLIAVLLLLVQSPRAAAHRNGGNDSDDEVPAHSHQISVGGDGHFRRQQGDAASLLMVTAKGNSSSHQQHSRTAEEMELESPVQQLEGLDSNHTSLDMQEEDIVSLKPQISHRVDADEQMERLELAKQGPKPRRREQDVISLRPDSPHGQRRRIPARHPLAWLVLVLLFVTIVLYMQHKRILENQRNRTPSDEVTATRRPETSAPAQRFLDRIANLMSKAFANFRSQRP
mmetsp:Transcript_124391/g.229162  ORF Transcript_124391/g.229162 Transcript_124391/m.229162 type:complete len:231 (-) Transcript_124391:7-699(-)